MAALPPSSSSSHNHYPIPFSLSDLSQTDISLLTQILSQPPTPTPSPAPTSHHNALRTLIRALPTHLLAPVPHQRTIASLFPPTTHLPPCTPLCALHRPLNAQLVHTIFTLLTTELGPRLNALTRPTLTPHLTPSQHLLIPRLQALHALWLPPPTYRARCHSDPEPRWSLQRDGCEACMLARVGGEKSVLLALRTVLVSRRQKGRPTPRLLRWVDGWIEGVGGQEAEALRVEGGWDGRELRGVRRVVRRVRMGMGRQRGVEGGERADGDVEGTESEDEDFENEIIEHYAGLPSSTNLPLPPLFVEGGRRLRLGRSQTGSAGFSDSSSWQTDRQSGLSLESRRRQDNQGVGEAEMRADEYRALLGSQASSDRQDGERRSGSTTWSAFFRR